MCGNPPFEGDQVDYLSCPDRNRAKKSPQAAARQSSLTDLNDAASGAVPRLSVIVSAREGEDNLPALLDCLGPVVAPLEAEVLFTVDRNRRGLKNDGTPAAPRIPIKRNQFGMSLGGPVQLPKLGKSKTTFFFFNYEGRREANPFSKQLTVPTAKMRKGDLSELLTGATRTGQTEIDGSPSKFGQVYDPMAPLAGGKRPETWQGKPVPPHS